MPVFYRVKELRRNTRIDPQYALEMCMDSDLDLDLELNLLGSDSEAEADSYLDEPGPSDRYPQDSTREHGAKRRRLEVSPPIQDFDLAVSDDDWSMTDVDEEPVQPADGDQIGEQDGDTEDNGEDDADVKQLHWEKLRRDAEGPGLTVLLLRWVPLLPTLDTLMIKPNREDVSDDPLQNNGYSISDNKRTYKIFGKTKHNCKGQNSSKNYPNISNPVWQIDSYFDLQTPWTIEFQNLQRLKCHRLLALEREKAFLTEDISSFCFSSLLKELCHFESPNKKETFDFCNISTNNIRNGTIVRCQQTKAPNFANMHESDTLDCDDLQRSNTLYFNHVTEPCHGKDFHSNRQQRFDEINKDILLGSKHNQTDGAQGVFSLFKNALLALIFQVSVSSHFARKFHHVVILVILLTKVACSDVHMNCSAHGVSVASINYPNELIDIIAPEGRMILLNFDYVSLGPADSLIISDTIEPVKTQYYKGEVDQDVSPFLSRRNQLRITPVLVGSSGRGFNITVSCYNMSETNTGRLVDGNTKAEGFLELSTQSESGGEWMRVCEEILSHRVAEIVCGELGYAIVKEVAYDNGECQSGGSGGNCVRAPVCEEYAYRLQDCSPPSTNCTSSKAVKIKCFEPGFIGCYNHGINQLQNSSIHNTTPECVSSCRSDTVQALAIVSDSQCFCPTANDIDLSDLTTERACTFPVYTASVGFCNQTNNVMNGSWDSNITWFGSIVHLTCDDGYNLIGSGTLQCVPGVSPFLPQWNDSMPSCENDTSSADSTPFPITTSLSTSDYVYPSPGTTSLDRLAATEIIVMILGAVYLILMIASVIFLCYRRCTAQSFVTSKKDSRKTEDSMKPFSYSPIRAKHSEEIVITQEHRM